MPDSSIISIVILTSRSKSSQKRLASHLMREGKRKASPFLSASNSTVSINSIAFSQDSRFIITASEDRSAKIWDTSGQLIVSLEGYRSDVKKAYFSPDMDYVVTNYGDGMIKIWPFDPELIEGKIKQFTDIDLTTSEKEKYGIK